MVQNFILSYKLKARNIFLIIDFLFEFYMTLRLISYHFHSNKSDVNLTNLSILPFGKVIASLFHPPE